MKLNLLVPATFVVVSIGLSSCTTGSHTIRTTEIGGGVVQTPLLADLSVSNTKVTGSAVYTTLNKYTNEGINYAKGTAVADALKASNADVLVEPTFDVTVSPDLFTVGIKVTVTGYPATYKNFRTATIADTTMVKMALDVSSANNIINREPIPPPRKHLGAFIAIGVGVLLLILAATGAL